MDRKQALAELLKREPEFLETAPKKVGGHPSYICPKCGNGGSGHTGTGIVFIPDSEKHPRWQCFKCGIHEDIIGLWKLHTGIFNAKEAFDSAFEYFHIPLDKDPARPQPPRPITPITPMRASAPQVAPPAHEPEPAGTIKADVDYTDYFKACQARIAETGYPQQRGLSSETAAKFGLGYDPHYTKDTGGRTWQALIIPTSPTSYVARNTDPNADAKNRYRKVQSSKLFNEGALTQTEKPVFIVEGELDALSIIESGGQAIGLGSIANYKQLLLLLGKVRPVHPLILALDNDEAGIRESDSLEAELQERGVLVSVANDLYGDCKDANASLLKDRESFKQRLAQEEDLAVHIGDAARNARESKYRDDVSAGGHLQEFLDGIDNSVNTPYIPTGLDELDYILEGGLYEGLYIIGAISSLGKTTFALQIADQVAQAGQDVLIFSLEMARAELMAKSISRLTFLDVLRNGLSTRNAKTTRGITVRKRYARYSDTEKQIIFKAINDYGAYADHIFIHEGIGNIGAEQVRQTVEEHIRLTGQKPVVLIDYVQILAPFDVRATDKQNTDKAVLELKRLSRDFKIPVIGISSFNRANYSVAVSMEAFKESGALEYGSDVLLGLQLNGAGTGSFNVNAAKQKNPRDVELVVLKNRNGATGGTICYSYYPMFNYFEEHTKPEIKAEMEKQRKADEAQAEDEDTVEF